MRGIFKGTSTDGQVELTNDNGKKTITVKPKPSESTRQT